MTAAFVGPRPGAAAGRPTRTRRGIELTGRTRKSPKPPGRWVPRPPDGAWPPSPDEFAVGWNSDLGRWIDLPSEGIQKWWQRPGYLTPNGYKKPPHWDMKTYALAVQEMNLAFIESAYVHELKTRGMTMEEIRARASTYEFIEPEGRKMTTKMKFLTQVKYLFDGREDDLIDLTDPDEANLFKMKPRTR
uniref:Uncharacterized protein n=1 Tax=Zooxanthella nutricula TaxID=1333877 RepID=A0A7S2VSY3_9DINO